MQDLKAENERLKSRIKKAIALLQEAHQHLDYDFNWIESDKYKKRIDAFLAEDKAKHGEPS